MIRKIFVERVNARGRQRFQPLPAKFQERFLQLSARTVIHLFRKYERNAIREGFADFQGPNLDEKQAITRASRPKKKNISKHAADGAEYSFAAVTMSIRVNACTQQ